MHSVSHPVGALYDTHHGMTNGVVLPYVLAFNRPAIEDRMGHLARVLGLKGDGFDAVFDWFLGFRKDLFIPDTLVDLGVPEEDLDTLAEKALCDPSTGGNPVAMTVDDFRTVIRAAIRGDLTLKG